jgi:ribonucleoside-diphosphate reductase alpha chain
MVGIETREIERAQGMSLVSAPRDWTAARVEAWLDWAEALPADYPAVALPHGLLPTTGFDPVLGAGPDRYARRAAAWGLALGLFDAQGALAFHEAGPKARRHRSPSSTWATSSSAPSSTPTWAPRAAARPPRPAARLSPRGCDR